MHCIFIFFINIMGYSPPQEKNREVLEHCITPKYSTHVVYVNQNIVKFTTIYTIIIKSILNLD